MKDEYSRLIAELNIANARFDWWILNFTNKNPIATPLCDQVYRALREKRMEFPKSSRVKNWIPAGPLFAFARSLFLKILSHVFSLPFPQPDESSTTVLFSLFNHQSFTADGSFRDAYFGDLPVFYQEKGKGFILMGQTMQSPARTLWRLSRQKSGLPILPIERALSFGDLLWCLWHSLQMFVRPPAVSGSMRIADIDVTSLVKNAIQSNVSSGRVFTDLCFFRSLRRVARRISLSELIYPFENRSWEKMLLFALRDSAPGARATGYQHASLTPKHLNFILEPGEEAVTPLPDRIVTMGEVTHDFMVEFGHYPPEKLETGCALRTARSASPALKPQPHKIRRILIALATNYGEYRGVFSLLDRALGGSDSYEIRVRPHPVYPLGRFLKQRGPLAFSFTEDKGPLQDSLLWADVVLYASSTLGLDAQSLGIPAIYVDWGDYLSVDPMAANTNLKWAITEPKTLAQVLREIEELNPTEFQSRQSAAASYVSHYAVPISETSLAPFFNRHIDSAASEPAKMALSNTQGGMNYGVRTR